VVLTAAVILLFLSNSHGQDTVSLKEIDITAPRHDLSAIGKKIQVIDSNVRSQFRLNSVSELLSLNSPVFIKSYGPAGIASTSFRGGGAEHTAVLWNGFNMQNMMLGQTDLSLLPSILFEDIGIEYGGSSSLWGSGCVAGSLHFNNNVRFNRKPAFSPTIGAGSFGAFNTAGVFTYGKARSASSTKIYTRRSRNNYAFHDVSETSSQLRRAADASYSMLGFMNEWKFLLRKNQVFSVNTWLNSNTRHIPMFSRPSRAYQEDQALRVIANWTNSGARLRTIVRSGYFADRIKYTDSSLSLFAKHLAQNFILENENYLPLSSWSELNFGLSVQRSSALSSSYSGEGVLQKFALLAGNKFVFFDGRLLTFVAARAEYFSEGNLPVTGNISAEMKPVRQVTFAVNAAKIYRQPTLNELYWVPGGNRSLSPEHGYTVEGTATYGKRRGRTDYQLSASAYSRSINDWILWVPGAGGNPIPMNIQQVWCRGTETSLMTNVHLNRWKLGIALNTGYVLSTVEKSSVAGTQSIGRQLIYTPRYTGNVRVSLGSVNTFIAVYGQYSGYRFTTADNSSWLDPYMLFSLRVNQKIVTPKIDFALFVSANNILNSDYMVVAGSPMPLRNFEGGVTLMIK
jgi:vitamin B12 transporter